MNQIPFTPALLLTDAANLPVALLIVFGSAKLLSEICERLGQPGIVGEILAGVLIGPSVFGWVQPDQVMEGLAEMGVMFLLFRVGLEVRTSEMLRAGPRALLVAVLGVAVPFALGCAVMAAMGASRIESYFIGASLSATSVGVTAHVLRTRGLLSERASQVILAAAVIDDILGLLILSFVNSLARGAVDLPSLIASAVLAAAFTVLIATLGTRTLQRIIPPVEQRLASTEAQFNLALVLLFALSALSLWLGIAAIVGAFLAGMALSDSVNRRVQDLAHGITELLVPFFLVNIGLNIDLRVFTGRRMLLLSLIVVCVAIASKLLGCGLAALRMGWRDMVRIGVGMVPRGEVGIVVAQIGLTLGVIDKSIYAMIVLMTVVTTIAAPPLLKYAYRGEVREVRDPDFRLS